MNSEKFIKKYGVGLVSFNMAEQMIDDLNHSFKFENPVYKVVIDNSPLCTSREKFISLGWIYIHNPSNPGFGVSHNLIFEKFGHEADFHLIVNPDISFKGDVIGPLLDFLSSKEDAGCVMPKICYRNGKIQNLAKLLPSPFGLIIRRLPFRSLKTIYNKNFELHRADYESGIFKVPFVSGCFLLFKSKVIKKLGFFDPRFFMYTEDTDLSRRFWFGGYFPYYFGKVKVTHGYEKGSSKNFRLFYIHVVSAIKYFNKWGWVDRQKDEINENCLNQFK